MAEDPLETVLRLVVEGRLTAEEAAPILAALDAKPSPGSKAGFAQTGTGAGGASPSSSSSTSSSSSADFGSAHGEGAAASSGRSLRIEVRDGGRTVVNLRLPLAIGRYALDRVPGLSGDQVERVKAALSSGMTGPVLVVDDENGGVRIAID